MGAVFNSYKLNQIFPTSTSASEEEKKKGGGASLLFSKRCSGSSSYLALSFGSHSSAAGLKNIVRGCLLAVMATFAGCFLLYTLPDAVASQLGKQLPYMFYERQVSSLLAPARLVLHQILV